MKPGEKVQVFNRPLQHRDIEGVAVLIEPAPPLTIDLDMGERWLVRFNPSLAPVIRWVHRNDRVEDYRAEPGNSKENRRTK